MKTLIKITSVLGVMMMLSGCIIHDGHRGGGYHGGGHYDRGHHQGWGHGPHRGR